MMEYMILREAAQCQSRGINTYMAAGRQMSITEATEPHITGGNASINATKYIKNNINRISIPVLLCQAGEDTLVSNEAQDYFVENTQNTQKFSTLKQNMNCTMHRRK